MGGQSDNYAFEISVITPRIEGPPLYNYTILMLKPTKALFHGYGGDVREVRDTAKAHIAFLKARVVRAWHKPRKAERAI